MVPGSLDARKYQWVGMDWPVRPQASRQDAGCAGAAAAVLRRQPRAVSSHCCGRQLICLWHSVLFACSSLRSASTSCPATWAAWTGLPAAFRSTWRPATPPARCAAGRRLQRFGTFCFIADQECRARGRTRTRGVQRDSPSWRRPTSAGRCCAYCTTPSAVLPTRCIAYPLYDPLRLLRRSSTCTSPAGCCLEVWPPLRVHACRGRRWPGMHRARAAVGTPHTRCGRRWCIGGCTNGRLPPSRPLSAGDVLALIRPKLTWGEAAAAQRDNRVRPAGCCAGAAAAAVWLTHAARPHCTVRLHSSNSTVLSRVTTSR